VPWLRYCTDVAQWRSTKLCTMFGRLLGWYAIYKHFWGSCLLTEFCQVQNSLSVQVLRSPTLAVLMHDTPAVGVSQTLLRGTRNGIMELLQTAPPIWQGGHHVGHRPTFLVTTCLLWPPCVADVDIIFLSRFLILLSFFPRLISAVADWMSTILRHMIRF